MSKIIGSASLVVSYLLGAAALGANDDILADTALDAAETSVVTVFAGQPDIPRVMTVKGNDANVSGDVVLEGTNFGGAAITETIALHGAPAVVGTKAFPTVTQAPPPTYHKNGRASLR